MRIVIDLEYFQSGAAPGALALALAIIADRPSDEIMVALSLRYPETIPELRHAFSALLPRDQVRAYELPPAGMPWSDLAAAAIRDNFIAALSPDLVLALTQADSKLSLRARIAGAAAASRTPAPSRPRLAYISPLPPQKSGIADYSAELIPELARFYDIDLIVDQPEVSDVRCAAHPLRQLDWFEQHGHEFDRVVYHFGNSGVHQHMFELIRRHPGIVVLHDFFLSNVLDNLECEGYLPQGYLRALYESHGYTGLREHRKIGRNPSIWKYPLNKGVIDNATGVIVHSDFSRQLADEWYGPGSADGWRTVPLLRGRQSDCTRASARTRLGIADDEFVVCSFGMLGRTKLNEELLDAYLASALAADKRCKLVFVGEHDAGMYGANLASKAAQSVAAARISVTGFVSAAQYADYLAAADAAVQLRTNTRGETSASVLDCLLHGTPTIANAHGSTAELADELLLKIPDRFSTAQLGEALERLRADGTLRAGLTRRALAHMQEHHTPARAGRLFHEAIEHFAAHSAHGHYRALLDTIAALPGTPGDDELAGAARAIAFNQPPSGQRQLFVDVSAMVHSDLKTGIQRVVRSVLLALIAAPPAGFRIEPVYSHGANRSYQYARRFAATMVGETVLQLEDAPVDLRPGDVFLGLDLFTNGTYQNHKLLQSMRERGVEIYFTVFDILPMLRPEVFPFGTEQYFGDYLRTVAAVSDGVICISRAVADELIDWIGREPAQRSTPLKVGFFHLGADIDSSAPSTGLPVHAQQVFDAVAARPSFLMVGTVEPRKGHAQALAAFELLWDQGVDINLVIVGKAGWMVDQLVEHMGNHPEKEKRLLWLPGISDEMLLRLYASSSALLAPSEGEGFGLPLIEAAQHQVPIIARDLPVFREVAGDHALYFEGLAPGDLARTIKAWLALDREGAAPASTGMRWLTWSESAQQVLDAIERQQWYRTVPAASETVSMQKVA